MKFGVCAIIKNENLYLREWIEHYINLGFDKIILYDNNEIDGEIPNVVIQDYIDKKLVDVYSYRGLLYDYDNGINLQRNAYNDCIQKYTNELQWIAFLDIDEFLKIKKYTDIHYLFEAMKDTYDMFDAIAVQSRWIGTGNQLYYRNGKVQERFTTYMKEDNNTTIKSIIKINNNVEFNNNVHFIFNLKYCTPSGHQVTNATKITCRISGDDKNVMYYNHYYTKSFYEFLYRSVWAADDFFEKIKAFKRLEDWTEEYEKAYQKFLKDNNIEAPK